MALTVSIWKIEFIAPNGRIHVLLDFGDDMADEFDLQAQQETAGWSPVGAAWGRNTADGAASRPIAWTRRTSHGSPAGVRDHCMSHPALMPFQQLGSLRISIQGGTVWELAQAVILSAVCRPVPRVPHTAQTAYSARAGYTRPTTVIPLFPGMPADWINQDPATISTFPENL